MLAKNQEGSWQIKGDEKPAREPSDHLRVCSSYGGGLESSGCPGLWMKFSKSFRMKYTEVLDGKIAESELDRELRGNRIHFPCSLFCSLFTFNS